MEDGSDGAQGIDSADDQRSPAGEHGDVRKRLPGAEQDGDLAGEIGKARQATTSEGGHHERRANEGQPPQQAAEFRHLERAGLLINIAGERKIQRGQETVEKESFPLKRGVHPMVDLLLGKATDERLEKYQRTILYLPLRTRDENMGILMVDNLLSQQEIPPEQFPILSAVAGQLGMAIKNSRLFQGVEELSITDGLTGLYLLRYFRQRLKEEFYRAERTHGQLSLMILDIDHFKRINDSYGHPAGDTILTTVAERVLANARKVDLTARYGGDEFVILLPDTAAEEALLLAERLHQAVSNEPVILTDKSSIHLTVSIGVATYPTHAATIDELIKRADEALYWIKSHGRNRIRLYSFEIPSKI